MSKQHSYINKRVEILKMTNILLIWLCELKNNIIAQNKN